VGYSNTLHDVSGEVPSISGFFYFRRRCSAISLFDRWKSRNSQNKEGNNHEPFSHRAIRRRNNHRRRINLGVGMALPRPRS